MRFQKHTMLMVLVPAFLSYSLWLYSSEPPGHAAPEADAGKLLWQRYNCGACHQLYGLGGYLGPDLTNVYSLRGEAGIRAFVQSGTAVMPAFRLTEQELQDLVLFLQSADRSGQADPRTFTLQSNGNIQASSR